MRTERNRLDLLVDSVGDPIIVTDPSGDILMTNAPAERFFTTHSAGAKDSQRRVQANVAQFSSFVSGLMVQSGTSGMQQRWRERLIVTEPETGRAVPMEAVAGTMMSGPSELTGVVTVLHDQTETIERERLYAGAAAGIGAARDAGARGDRRARPPERAPAPAGPRAGAGVGCEVTVSRQRLARVPHAAQRHPRLFADADGRLLRAAVRGTIPHGAAHRCQQQAPRDAHQRRARHRAHRGRPYAAADFEFSRRGCGAGSPRGASGSHRAELRPACT